MAVLGIDFGTSYSFIVKLSESDGKERVELFGKDLYEAPRSANAAVGGDASFYLKHSKGIRTWIALANDGKWVVGKNNIETALKNKTVSEENICRNIKDLLRNCTSANDIGNKSGRCGKELNQQYYSGIELTTEFFKEIVQSNEDNPISVETKDIEAVVIGVPACEVLIKEQAETDSYVYRANLTEKVLPEICKALGLDPNRIKMSVWPEPILAGFAYRKLGAIEKEQDLGRTLVIDIGGGTSDFAIVENRNGKFSLFKQSRGGRLPAGNTFNKNLREVIREQCKVQIDNDDDLEAAKEELFLSPYAPQFQPLETEETDYLENYLKYYAHGRRCVVTKDRKSYYVAFNKACLGDPEGEEPTAIWDTEKGFKKIYNAFSKRFLQFWNQITDSKKTPMEEMFQSVFFVGGTCAMFPLRYRICKYLLGLTPVTENVGDYLYVTQWKRGGNRVPVFFPELESGSYLSCSNTIALGAAYFGAYLLQKGDPIGLEFADIPELWLRFHTSAEVPDYPLFSKQFKQNGRLQKGEPCPCVIRCRKGTKRLPFQIIRKEGDKEVVYPRGGNYYGPCPPSSFQDQDKEYSVLIFADYEATGVVIYVCYYDQNNSQCSVKKPVRDYIYQLGNGKQLRLSEHERFGEAFRCGVSGVGDSMYCRRYVFSSGGKQDKEGNVIGKKYSIWKHLQNNQFELGS